MSAIQEQTDLPYAAQRILAKYEPTIRARLAYYLSLRPKDEPCTWDSIGAAISSVFGELTGTREPKFSSEIERRAMEDFEQGRYKTTREWADELRSRLA
jgi:hypothetical protein